MSLGLMISFLVPMVLGFCTMVIMLIDAFKGPRQVQALRLFEAGLCFYFLMIYVISLWGTPTYLILSGIMTRIGVSLIFIVVIIDAVISRRRCKGGP